MLLNDTIFRSAYSERSRSTFNCSDATRTKQSHKDECDINRILSSYKKSGIITHASNKMGEYGDASSVDFHASMNMIKSAQAAFDELPSSVRKRFGNDPAAFLDFVQDEKNVKAIVEMGLAEPVTPPEVVKVEVVAQPTVAPIAAAEAPEVSSGVEAA